MKSAEQSSNEVEFVSELADVLVQSNLHELELTQDGMRVELWRESTFSNTASPVAGVPQAAPAAAEDDPSLVTVTSPMVGVFYRSPSPNDPPFVEEGDEVEKGQAVGLVEAMKVFNEIVSEVDGEVVAVKAQSGDLVESGSALVLVRPVEK